MAIHFTPESRKACKEAHAQVQSHYWGDKGNAGKYYVRGKNSHKYVRVVATSVGNG